MSKKWSISAEVTNVRLAPYGQILSYELKTEKEKMTTRHRAYIKKLPKNNPDNNIPVVDEADTDIPMNDEQADRNTAWTRGGRLRAKLSSILESPGSDSSAEEFSSQIHTPDANGLDSAAKLSSTLESPGPDSSTENFSRWIRTPDMNDIDSASGGQASTLATVSSLPEQQDPDSSSAVSLVLKPT